MCQVNTIFILLLYFFVGCQNPEPKQTNPELIQFNKFLGGEKAKCLDKSVESFERFLETNYPHEKGIQNKTKAFLMQLDSTLSPDSNWVFETKKNELLLRSLESSGMRIEIYRYGYEDYSPDYDIEEFIEKDTNTKERTENLEELVVEIEDEEWVPISDSGRINDSVINRRLEEQSRRLDSMAWFNMQGQFLFGLSNFGSQDSIINEYVNARFEVGFISPTIMIAALLQKDVDYLNPFVKRMLVAELYLDLMRWDLKRNSTTR